MKLADNRQVKLTDLPLEDLQGIEPRLTKDIFEVLSAEAALKARGLL